MGDLADILAGQIETLKGGIGQLEGEKATLHVRVQQLEADLKMGREELAEVRRQREIDKAMRTRAEARADAIPGLEADISVLTRLSRPSAPLARMPRPGPPALRRRLPA